MLSKTKRLEAWKGSFKNKKLKTLKEADIESYEDIQKANDLWKRIEKLWSSCEIPQEDWEVFTANYFDDPSLNIQFLKQHTLLLLNYKRVREENYSLIEERDWYLD